VDAAAGGVGEGLCEHVAGGVVERQSCSRLRRSTASVPARYESLPAMRTVLNVIWLVLVGVWLAFAYHVAAVLLAVTMPDRNGRQPG
jgi:hypothetical protein